MKALLSHVKSNQSRKNGMLLSQVFHNLVSSVDIFQPSHMTCCIKCADGKSLRERCRSRILFFLKLLKGRQSAFETFMQK